MTERALRGVPAQQPASTPAPPTGVWIGASTALHRTVPVDHPSAHLWRQADQSPDRQAGPARRPELRRLSPGVHPGARRQALRRRLRHAARPRRGGRRPRPAPRLHPRQPSPTPDHPREASSVKTTTHRPELVLTEDQIRADRDRWLVERNTGIGASDIAAVLGLSPWDSPFSYYWRRQLGTAVEPDEAMEWGLRHERTIAEKFSENHPEFVVRPGGLYRHPEHRWMLATPDLLLHSVSPDHEDALAQIKTTRSWDGWGDAGTDQIPAYYAAQVQQEMTVMGATRCWVPVLCGGNSYREYLVRWDLTDAETITAAGADFMARLDAGTPPDVDGAAATTAALKQLHPTLVDDVVTIPLDLADQYWTRRQLASDAQAALVEVENRIRALLGDYKTAVAGGQRIAQRSVYDTTRIDTKRLKAEQPDIYADYSTTSTVNKLMPCKESK